ncbi:MAG TPA: tRNA epoxyqueuosine(34) reductase QueG [Terriglobales bacterium]|nr:tRNA epoxyqueuosine(34) reductase QueG [Terriglobales bacterium]
MDLARILSASEHGFDLVGVASLAQPLPELDFFPGWIDRGAAGEMEYLKARDDQGRLKRASVQATFPWAKSALVGALNYNTGEPYSTECRDSRRGWISRYAWFPNTDYHDAVMSRLVKLEAAVERSYPGARTWRYVDTGPLLERVLARHAGIGWLAKNTCVINEQLGSWLFLGIVLTSLELAPTLPVAADRCGSCTACIDACPTDAIPAPYQLDASRCISYLTIEKRGDLPADLRAGMGNHLFGCDICQDVCPWNDPQRVATTRAPEFVPAPAFVNPPLAELATMSREDFQRRFRGSPVKRAKYSGLRRNAVVAMGNSGDPEFAPALERLAHDEDPIVASHARWSLERLRK